MRTQPNPCRRKLQAIIFDFDGVLVESLDIKTDAFIELFKDYPENMDAFIPYHRENGGISRYAKIRYFFSKIRRESITENDVMDWAERYSQLVVEKVTASSFVKGAEELLNACDGRYTMFIVSGTPQEEMRLIAQRRKLDRFFKGIFGSPEDKTSIVQKILSENNLDPSDVVFVGDAKSDFEAAQKHRIPFIARVHNHNEQFFDKKDILGQFSDLTELYPFLQKLDQG